MNPLVLLVASLTAWLLAGCASSPEDNVSRLSGDADEREAARQELLLAKERAVAPLLVALEDPARIGARQSVVEVLAGLMTRVEAPEISAALIRHLHADDDKVVRARIAHHLGLHRHTAAADALLGALHDTDGEVRYQVLLALARMEARLDSSQIGQLRHTARELLQDDDVRVRGEALIALSAEVSEWLDQAQKAALEGRLTEAESFYLAAVDVSPSSKRAHHRLGRFYYDNGQRDRGLDLLRAEGML
ncbi:MAG: hypothetical protein HN404_23675, partial [Gemmatimonadetes bacterium]|nr:hypothetical protein [Gemmatimonadota bacterium]